MPNNHLGRRSALALGLAAPFLARSAGAAPLAIPDAIGRSVTLPAAAERIVLLFNYEEFTAIAGVAGWDRVVGYARTQWAVNRSAIFRRYAVPIPRLLGMPDVGNTEENTFSVERVMSLRPDVVIMPEWVQAWLDAATPTDRERIAARMQDLAAMDAPTVPIGQFYINTAYRTSITGVVPSPTPVPWGVRRV